MKTGKIKHGKRLMEQAEQIIQATRTAHKINLSILQPIGPRNTLNWRKNELF